ncbi:hypothetical protein THII_3124 [Thioploca ingrica]|uniref:DUF2330 domain-containing protein n=1 Tax=Thioploca ingrica TaxID=40754 RepID=A0A090BVT6_9GAMM|nr:hypothetical protein THII_3124 [Thioploca ingrica]
MLTKWYIAVSLLVLSGQALSFCGFYVAKADTKLFNKASQVVLVRDGDNTVLTMANDFKGDLKEFAVVIPVPTFIEKKQIRIVDKAYIDHLDDYTAPRLVEYFDENPCPMPAIVETQAKISETLSLREMARDGVKIEAQYTVGEYDILVLSAEQSDGLAQWLKENGYRIPDGAEPILGSYIKQNMRFFVARVNLTEQAKLGYNYLRPLQVAYQSPKFMLPIRLGTVNATRTQELFIYTLTRQGRVETTNYRTIKLPTDMDLPVYIKEDFTNFYRALFERQVEKEKMRTVFLEYAWDMNFWCDPCSAEPLSAKELSELGVFWIQTGVQPKPASPVVPANVFVTRLHVRYDAENFPEDLIFQETGDRSNFQSRYVLRHPWQGTESCRAAKKYRRKLTKRLKKEAQELANLTGWDIQIIRQRINSPTTQ